MRLDFEVSDPLLGEGGEFSAGVSPPWRCSPAERGKDAGGKRTVGCGSWYSPREKERYGIGRGWT
jgi:hypothetical protein